MTRPTRSVLNKHSKTCSLVLEGNEIKFRLQAERIETGTLVHVDWVRFTCLLRNAPMPGIETLFPTPTPDVDMEPVSEQERTERGQRLLRLRKLLAKLPNAEFAPSAQAMELAERVAETLGEDFTVAPELRKGHDFYRHRWSIERNGSEVGWVGFLASGDSPRQQAQAKTMHVNLYGTACTFAQNGWRDHLANLIDDVGGTLTRIDLALDFFEGITGGMERIKRVYENGLCDVAGKRPKCNMVGDWCNGKARSFYMGSKEAGKQTNFYEKGHQLFGEKDATNWLRAELRYGNKLRVLNTDMLRRPQDYFAGASDYHAAILREAKPAMQALPESVPCEAKLAAQTIEAEVTRNVRWLRDVAAPSMALAFEHLGTDAFLEMVTNQNVPGRLRRFKQTEIRRAYSSAHHRTRKAASAGHAFAQA
jgi:phage replication initiation protein